MPWTVDDGVAEDAVSLWTVLDREDVVLLPEWYQPAPMRRRLLTGWRRRIAITTVVALVAISAAGLCSTYGYVELA